MTKKAIRKIIRIFLLVLSLVIINIGYSGYSSIATIQVFNYGDIHSGFDYDCFPQKGVDLERMLAAVDRYDKANGTKTEICRKFSKNYLRFWQWHTYLTNPYYKFPKC